MRADARERNATGWLNWDDDGRCDVRWVGLLHVVVVKKTDRLAFKWKKGDKFSDFLYFQVWRGEEWEGNENVFILFFAKWV